MKLPSEIRFADPKIKEAFYKLETGDGQEKELFKIISKKSQSPPRGGAFLFMKYT